MIDIPFLKKFSLPKISLGILTGRASQIAGVDIGMYSTKVVQLRYEKERAILENYGELLNERYFKGKGGIGGGFLRYSDNDIAEIIKDLFTESKITAQEIVFSLPAASGFVVKITLPKISPREVQSAIPFEARKYIPIPMSEVVLDWDLLPSDQRDVTEVLLVAVPREAVEKFKRVAAIAHIRIRALEIETFSLARSLIAHDPTPTAIISIGHYDTSLAIVDQVKLRVSHHFDRGCHELTKALERGLNVNIERAEQIKQDIGLGERVEDKEITSILTPFLQTLMSEIDRVVDVYNRKAARKVQKINLTGGGSQLKGIVEFAATHFGIEVTKGNPFARVVSPAFMQPVLRQIGPAFSIATGLALHEITAR